MQILNTSTIHTQNRSLTVEWEKYWCFAAGMVMFVVLGVFAKHWLGIAGTNHWHIDNLYSAVFGLATFVSGFFIRDIYICQNDREQNIGRDPSIYIFY
jgi:hypothetical protein